MQIAVLSAEGLSGICSVAFSFTTVTSPLSRQVALADRYVEYKSSLNWLLADNLLDFFVKLFDNTFVLSTKPTSNSIKFPIQ